MRIVTREEMRAIDRWAIETAGIPSIALMENAGRGVAEVVLEAVAKRRGAARDPLVVVVCGRGNNGGDGFVAYRHLLKAGCAAAVACVGPESDFDAAGDAGANFRVARGMRPRGGRLWREIAEAGDLAPWIGPDACVVDALFGTGLSRSVEGLCRDVIEAINASRALVVAVDVPSGLDVDTGLRLGAAMRASVTATMAFPKAGFYTGEGPAHCGTVRVIDIGLPRDVPAWDGTGLII